MAGTRMHVAAATVGGAGLALLAATGAASAWACAPAISALPDTGHGGTAVALNGHHVIVGGVQDASGTLHAAWWGPGGALHLVRSGLVRDTLVDVNDHGLMLGSGPDAAGSTRSYVLAGGTLHWLGGLGPSDAEGRRLNQRGQIAGTAVTEDGAHVLAVRWASFRAAPVAYSPQQPGDTDAFGLGLDDAGHLSGDTDGPAPAYRFRPAIWRGTRQPQVLETTAALPWGSAHLLDDAGESAGDVDSRDGSVSHAAFWTRGGRLVDLGVVPGTLTSSAFGLAQNGWVAGGSMSFPAAGGPPTASVAFLWPGRGPLLQLPTLAGRTTGFANAHALDAAGTVVGFSTDAANVGRATVWECAQRLAFVPTGLPATPSGEGASALQPEPWRHAAARSRLP